MNLKSSALVSIKTVGEAGSGAYESAVSVFGNIDHDGDRVHKGAFLRAIKDQSPPPVVYSHNWLIPPIGETLDWDEKTIDGKECLWTKGNLFVGADDKHQYADMAYAAMKSRDGRPPALNQFSYSFDVPEGGAEKDTEEIDGKNRIVQNLKELYPIYEVGPCLRGANPATSTLQPPKARDIADAIKSGAISVNELRKLLGLDELTPEAEKNVVHSGKYPSDVTALLLAAPTH